MQHIKLKPFLQSTQTTTTSSVSVQLAPGTDFAAFAQQTLKDLKIAGGVDVYLEGVVYDDYTYVGSDRFFGPIQRCESKVHR